MIYFFTITREAFWARSNKIILGVLKNHHKASITPVISTTLRVIKLILQFKYQITMPLVTLFLVR